MEETGFKSVRFLIVPVLCVVAAGLLVASAGGAPAHPVGGSEPLPPGTTIETVEGDLENPVSMAFDPQGRLFFTEKETGRVRLIVNDALVSTPVITFSISFAGERGLLGIAVDPNFNSNRYVYVYYTSSGPSGPCAVVQNRVVRFVENGGVGSNPTTIFTSCQSAGNHVGGNIHFGPDGKLYVTVGDNADAANSQDHTVTQGKLHRINSDGTIPPDNPVFTQTGALQSLYAIGLRNSFDFTFDPLTPGRIFASENGPACDDEMNRIERGYNYGWRANYPCDDPNPSPTYNTIPPLWFLGSGQCCEAPTGITVYTGNQVPQWTNHLFMANFSTGRLYHFYLNADRTALTATNAVEGVTANMDLVTGPDGAFWYIEGGGYGPGIVKRIKATTPQPTPQPTPTPLACARFADVPSGNEFYPYIACLACRGIIGGYPCGGPNEPCSGNNDPYFRPNNNITRGQIAKVVSESAGFSEPPGGQLFADVPPGNTFYTWVNRLANRGIMGGYPCGGPGEPCGAGNTPYFRPNANSTRGQLAKVVSNAAGFSDPPGGQTFQDVSPSNPFYQFIQRLASRGIMGGYPCGGPGEPCVPPQNRPYFRPNNNVTRAQSSKIISNTFFPACQAR